MKGKWKWKISRNLRRTLGAMYDDVVAVDDSGERGGPDVDMKMSGRSARCVSVGTEESGNRDARSNHRERVGVCAYDGGQIGCC